MMTYRFSIPALISLLLIVTSCSSQEPVKEETAKDQSEQVESKKKEAHRYGGWYCPDNFGFVPVDIQKLDEVPAIADRLPTEDELHNNMSLINVDTEKYPDARALEMDLPRVAQVPSRLDGMNELIIVIQAIVVQEDTVVGYRFANGGNGSARIGDVRFLSDDELSSRGSQPFFYSKTTVKASTAEIWKAIGKTDYFKQLGEKFNEQDFFSSDWNPEARVRLNLDTESEKATGFVGMLYGNYYLHMDYNRDGFHYSEKLFLSENSEDKTTELHFASGPYPNDFEKYKSDLDKWIKEIKTRSQKK